MFLVRWYCMRLPISEPQNHLSEQVHRPKEVASKHLCALLNCGLGAFSPTQDTFSFLCKLVSDFLPSVTFNSILLSQFPGFSFSSPSSTVTCVSNDVSLVTLACFFQTASCFCFPLPICILLSPFYSQVSPTAPHLSCSTDPPPHLFSLVPGSPPPHAVPTSCPLLCVQRWAVNTH